MSINVCNDRSMASITSLPSGVSGGSLVLLETQTASSSDTISFTSNIDSTYKEYQIHYIDVHAATNDTDLTINFRDGSTAYDATKTTTYFSATHNEDGSGGGLSYETAVDLAQSTGVQKLSKSGIGNDNDHSACGVVQLFDPSSTTFVKHFIIRSHYSGHDEQSRDDFIAGYCNTTTAIDGVQFKFASGNIDAGTFKLYGVV